MIGNRRQMLMIVRSSITSNTFTSRKPSRAATVTPNVSESQPDIQSAALGLDWIFCIVREGAAQGKVRGEAGIAPITRSCKLWLPCRLSAKIPCGRGPAIGAKGNGNRDANNREDTDHA